MQNNLNPELIIHAEIEQDGSINLVSGNTTLGTLSEKAQWVRHGDRIAVADLYQLSTREATSRPLSEQRIKERWPNYERFESEYVGQDEHSSTYENRIYLKKYAIKGPCGHIH